MTLVRKKENLVNYPESAQKMPRHFFTDEEEIRNIIGTGLQKDRENKMEGSCKTNLTKKQKGHLHIE